MSGKRSFLIMCQVPRWVIIRTPIEGNLDSQIPDDEATHVILSGKNEVHVQLLNAEEIEEEREHLRKAEADHHARSLGITREENEELNKEDDRARAKDEKKTKEKKQKKLDGASPRESRGSRFRRGRASRRERDSEDPSRDKTLEDAIAMAANSERNAQADDDATASADTPSSQASEEDGENGERGDVSPEQEGNAETTSIQDVKDADASGDEDEEALADPSDDDIPAEDAPDLSGDAGKPSTTSECDKDLGDAAEKAKKEGSAAGKASQSKKNGGSSKSSKDEASKRKPGAPAGVIQHKNGEMTRKSQRRYDEIHFEDESEMPSKTFSDGSQSINVEGTLQLLLDKAYADGLTTTIPLLVRSQDNDRAQVSFCALEVNLQDITTRLERVGIGSIFGIYTLTPVEKVHVPNIQRGIRVPLMGMGSTVRKGENFDIAKASELRVEQVVAQIRDAASFTFDYASLVILASILGAVGLATDNVVVIVASMLVSPIMGPVLGATFGTIVADYSLMWLGLRNEILSLLLCILTGAVVGVIMSFFEFTDEAWPTSEMTSRGEPVGLLVGLAIALPSGVGVALSVLGNNTASLVGVAISASLLPPAVAAGLEWAFASAMENIQKRDVDVQEYNLMGTISLALTILNIVAIYGAALVMFKIKEVAPLKNKPVFWESDVKLNRKLRTMGRGFADSEDGKKLLAKLRKAAKRPGAVPENAESVSTGGSHYESFAAYNSTRRGKPALGSIPEGDGEMEPPGSHANKLMSLFRPQEGAGDNSSLMEVFKRSGGGDDSKGGMFGSSLRRSRGSNPGSPFASSRRSSRRTMEPVQVGDGNGDEEKGEGEEEKAGQPPVEAPQDDQLFL